MPKKSHSSAAHATPSGEPVAAVSAVIGEGADAHRLIRVGEWSMTAWINQGDADEPRIRDIDLGERLGYERPRKIRELIERLVKEGKLQGVYVRPTVGRTSMPRGGVRNVTVNEYWPTEAQALKIIAKSETEIADAILDEMIHVFMLARRGLLPGQTVPSAFIEQMSAVVAGIAANNNTLVAVVDALSRRMDIIEAQQASRPANDGDGIGQSAAERHILAPLRRIARLKHAALHAPTPGAMRKIRMIEERSLRRELDYQMEKRAAWSKLPPARLAAAKAAIDRMTDNAENLAMIAGVTSPELLGPLFEKVTDPRRMN